MMPRALMVPPGMPEFLSRARTVEPGRHRLTGRAWSGWGPVVSVDVSTDGGVSWAPAEVGPAVSAFAWHPWWFDWDAEPGRYELSCAATDAAGNGQPVDQAWNFKGYANNEVQRVGVTVRGN